MKNRLSRRQKMAMVAVLVAVPVVGGVGSAYLTAYGDGASTATVAASPPAVTGGATVSGLVPDAPTAATVEITNTLDRDIIVTGIPAGASPLYSTANDPPDAFNCPAASVVIGAVGDHSNPLAQVDGTTIVIPANGGVGMYPVTATFDVASFPVEAEVVAGEHNQDGCLGQTLAVEFGAISFMDAP